VTAALDQSTGEPQEPRSGGRRAGARTTGAAADVEHVVIGSGFMFTLVSPLMLLIDLLIHIGSRGSVFYRQKRNGKGGRAFMMIMVQSAQEVDLVPAGLRVVQRGQAVRPSGGYGPDEMVVRKAARRRSDRCEYARIGGR
jgi:hypothetical protein